MSAVSFVAGIFGLLSVSQLLPQQATAQDAVAVSTIMQELACQRSPNPTPVLRYLLDEKFIRLRDQKGYDSISCWRLTRPFDLKGLSVSAVCAAEENALLHRQNPGFYWRGPGTSPGTRFSVATTANPQTVKAWVASNLSMTGPQIEPSDLFTGMTAIECSGMRL